MEMSNSCKIPASPQVTWNALNNPQFLKDCIAGCDRIEQTGPNEYAVHMAVSVGPVNARFSGRMVLSDQLPPQSYVVTFEGQGGPAGFAKGRATVTLAPQDSASQTLMSYAVTAQVGGKLAQIGSRLVDGAARKVADQFFAAFTAKVTDQQRAQVPVAADESVEETGAAKPWIGWAAAGAAAAAALWWLTARSA